jgi:hypothetical protein
MEIPWLRLLQFSLVTIFGMREDRIQFGKDPEYGRVLLDKVYGGCGRGRLRGAVQGVVALLT